MDNRSPAPEFLGRSLLRDFRLLLMVFVLARLTLAIVYQPYIIEGVERGLSAQGDLSYHYAVAALSQDGLYPYADFWYEYPPVFPALSVGLYKLLSFSGPAGYTAYATALGMLLIAFDAGNLVLIRRIARRLYGDARALEIAWIYALLPMPLILNWWTFDGMIAFFMLLGLALLLEGRAAASGVAVAAGILVKFMPVMMLPAVWRFRSRREAIVHTAVVLGAAAIVLGAVVVGFDDWGLDSLTVQFTKSSYQTVWALIDGNLHTGIFTGDHFAPPASAARDNPAKVPAWLRLAVFGGVGLYVFTRRLRTDGRGMVAFVGITCMLFLLWSQAWSPQWLMWVVPLILLCFPTRDGVLLLMLLGLLVFVEYPQLFLHTAETQGSIAGVQKQAYYLIVFARTAIWAMLAAGMNQMLTSRQTAPHAAGDDTGQEVQR
jgi:hypothetical protein